MTPQEHRFLATRSSGEVSAGGDHSFFVLKRSGRTFSEVLDEIAGAVGDWTSALV